MTFEPVALDGTEDFSGATKDIADYVDGTDKWVYWRGCEGVSVKENNERKVCDLLSGKVKLEHGVELYFFKGEVKREE